MKTVDLDQVAGALSDYVRDVDREPIVLMRASKPVAAIVGLGHADIEATALSASPEFSALIERSRARYLAEGGIPIAALQKSLNKKPTKRSPKKRG